MPVYDTIYLSMKFIDFSKNYQRLFRFDAFSHIWNDNWMVSYRKRDALVLTLGENTTIYMPKSRIEKFLEEGVKFFADNEQFQKYRSDYEIFSPIFPSYFKSEIEPKELLDLPSVSRFFDLAAEVFDYFYRTEFFYLDEAYAASSGNRTISENLKILYVLKEHGRVEHINDGFFGENSYSSKLIKKLSAQFRIPTTDLLNYGVEEIKGLFVGDTVSAEMLKAREVARIISSDRDRKSYLFGEEAKAEILEFREKTGDVIPYGAAVLKGTPANKGIARGKVKIIISNPETIDFIQDEFKKMGKGDILVAETTSPEFMPACRKASAIIADQGGLLSHAAVVSREFGIPSIVATKYATKVLKDGDIVEVDGGKGTVTVLKRI